MYLKVNTVSPVLFSKHRFAIPKEGHTLGLNLRGDSAAYSCGEILGSVWLFVQGELSRSLRLFIGV